MSDGFERCWEALKSNLMVEDEESLAREAWKAGREHGRGDTAMTKPMTLDQAKQVLAEAGMVAVDGRRNGFIEGLATAAASQIGMTIEQFIVECEFSAQKKPDA
jgi:hypothetical protein